MAIRYPDSWGQLTNPQARLELLEYLKEAGDPLGFRDQGAVEALVHFVFDDHDFFPDPVAELGVVLVDAKEARALSSFVGALDTAIGPRSRPLAAVDAQKWEQVARSAQAAHATLIEQGCPVFQ